ncbi:anti-sigma factor family protein [Pseudactinotalea sp.]|uniref:anti-sigma factor family protein n=1 Tax=Pseudactinotalea sp. TaxID=1926260 RepID=UPI003B3B53D1
MSSHDEYREWDAAYVLGALSPAERREFERHLAGCEACREAVAELAGTPAALSSLDRSQAVALVSSVPDGGGSGGGEVVPISSLATAAARRRRRLRGWQAAAAVALVAVGGVGGVALSDLGGASATEVTAVTLEQVGGSNVTADLTLTPSTWGTRMEWSCSYPDYGGAGSPGPEDGVYELVLIDADGERTVAATWTGDGGDHASGLLASSAIGLEDITRVELGVEGVDVVLAAADLGEA